MRSNFLLILLLLCSIEHGKAQAGKLDPTFGIHGFITNDRALYFSTAVQKDGKIVVAGVSDVDFAVARYNTNGSPDSSFSNDGFQTTHFSSGVALASAIAMQSDGKIVLAGYATIDGGQYDFALARYTTDGNLDKSFSYDGKQIYNIGAAYTFAEAMAVQADGKIVVAGYSYTSPTGNADFTVARINNNGSLDKSFSGDGKLVTDFGDDNNDYIFSVAIQADGKIVTAGYTGDNIDSDDHNKFALARYTVNGTLDNTFSEDGKQIIDFDYGANAYSVALQDDGKIVVAGKILNKTYNFALARYNTDGSSDDTFSADGKQTTAFGGQAKANAIAIQRDGKIIIAGEYKKNDSRLTDFALARYNADGNLDSNFNFNGIEITQGIAQEDRIAAIKIDNNKLYAVGVARRDPFQPFTSVIARYLLDTGNTPPNRAPIVAIMSPASDTNIVVPGSILLKASASDTDGVIQSVAFYNNATTLLFTDSTPPFEGLWFPVPTGKYHITAVATDNSGEKSTSVPVRITVLHYRPPIVKLTSPADLEIYAAPADIVFSAEALGHGVKIRTVDFFNRNSLIFTEYAAPFYRKWYNVKEGEYVVTAKATDRYGRSTISAPVRITVKRPAVLPVTKVPTPALVKSKEKDLISFDLAPNPARSILNIFTTGLHSNQMLSIISSSRVVVKTIQAALSNQPYKLNVSSLVSGLYLIKIIFGDKVMYRQFVKI